MGETGPTAKRPRTPSDTKDLDGDHSNQSPTAKKRALNDSVGAEMSLATAPCQHLAAAIESLQPPRVSQQVHKEECTLCFDDQDGPAGIDVCLHCFNGGCPATKDNDRQHAKLHMEKSGHSIVINVKRTAKPKEHKKDEGQPVKLAIEAETEADKYDFQYTLKCLSCVVNFDLHSIPKLQAVVDGVIASMSSAQQTEVKSWEEEIVSCTHTENLVQLDEAHRQKIDSTISASGEKKAQGCSQCDLTSNLWLCLTCGNLGCGRAQFGGVGGNSHGLAHFEATGHPCSVKQGTITPEGTADVYCYACNDSRLDNKLASHLGNLGIKVATLSKTEKSMTELQVEQNLTFDFSMTGEDGEKLKPVFGPGLTGLRNLGNSCYLASTMQTLFSLPAFARRYGDAYRPHTLTCEKPLPAECLECQLGKLADGLLSGRYSVPAPGQGTGASSALPTSDASPTTEEEVRFQSGVKPSMFKSLIGKGHQEFATMRQQDADEFLKHLVDSIQRENRRVQQSASASAGAPTEDATSVFAFELENRLQCTACRKVRYTVERQDAGISLPVPLRPVANSVEEGADVDVKQKGAAEGEHASSDIPLKDGTSPDKVKFEPVSMKECLDIFTGTEAIQDYSCPSCQKKTTATKQLRFKSFPQAFAFAVRRFQLIGWVPQKVDVQIQVPLGGEGEDAGLNLDAYLGRGIQEGEEELPKDESASGAGAALPAFDAGAMSQLTAMGFPEIRCQKALLATGNTGDAEAAMNWLFAHMEDADIDAPIDLSAYAATASAASSAPAPDTSALEDMGFSKAQATKALRVNGANAEMAVAWLFENPDDPGEEPGQVVDGGDVGTSSQAQGPAGDSSLPAHYKIKSFISHKGPSVHSGHYVAHIRKLDADGGWVLFNDEKVVQAPLSSSAKDDPQSDVGVRGLSQLAYVYFFERV